MTHDMADTEMTRDPIPNEETREAIRQARAGEGLSTYGGIEELIAELDDAQGRFANRPYRPITRDCSASQSTRRSGPTLPPRRPGT